jgi:hypothetical protein
MPVKPSDAEEEYFARQEVERRAKAAAQREAAMKEDERRQQRELHFMRCPKCGMHLEEISFGNVRVDKCFSCEGMWLDKGEFERMQEKEPGFGSRLMGIFRPASS